MDSKKVNALLTANELGSLTAAATALGYTQSGLTHMMNSLEDELGINLLVRSKGGVHLSPAGQELLPSMLAFARTAEELEAHASKLRERSYTNLRVGAYSSIARNWVPAILSEFVKACPDMDVSITMSSVKGTYDLVKNAELDCALVSYQPSMCQGLAWVPLHDDALVAILPGDYKLESESFSAENFTDMLFLMPSSGFDLDITPVFAQGGRKIAPRIRYTNLDDAAIVSMVAHNLGVTVMSELVMRDLNDDVITAPLDPPSFRRLGIIMSERRQNDKNIRKLVRCAQSTISEMYSE